MLTCTLRSISRRYLRQLVHLVFKHGERNIPIYGFPSCPCTGKAHGSHVSNEVPGCSAALSTAARSHRCVARPVICDGMSVYDALST